MMTPVQVAAVGSRGYAIGLARSPLAAGLLPSTNGFPACNPPLTPCPAINPVRCCKDSFVCIGSECIPVLAPVQMTLPSVPPTPP
jgi:hypothetical protein